MKKNLILIVFILIISTFIFSNTNDKQTSKNSKFIEFAVGGSFSHCFNFKYSIQKRYYENRFYLEYLSFTHLFSSSLVFEFDYYINKKFSLGIIVSLGYGASLSYFFLLGINNLIFTLKFNNKFGNLFKNMLVLEYGISLIGQYGLSYNYNGNFSLILGDISTTFRGGPNLLIGYELKTKKNFKFLIGGTFEANFDYYTKMDKLTKKYDNAFFSNFLWGIEFRWSFYSINELK
ncbi:MAG: hypothetical protein A2086_09170 [Spirochaetes bacterium GWD1_27_9]|nr:MAG: hypothetical protein A2Z98_12985 [Spirochaetes bacterium GWB1_27_13]OHD20420.1 MAG: hypothetical protein A2Y34_10565 [Spirochaetes bacterium GWC1_27_15]OHD31982.1 MAG: hypothetical protein A2086_09170 [Spirochaetes bacterium GWD1_27_9]